MKIRRKRTDYLAEAGACADWPERPPLECVDEMQRGSYSQRCRAVEMWLAGKSGKGICKATGLTAHQALRLFVRCSETNPRTRRPYGFAACVPGTRNQGTRAPPRARNTGHQRTDDDGWSGVLSQLFRTYPEIERELVEFVKSRKVDDTVKVPAITKHVLHMFFLAR